MEDKDRRITELEAELAALKARLTPEFGKVLNARERLLVEAERVAHLGSWSWDLPSGEVQWSDELFRVLGFSPGSVEPSSESFFAAIDERDRERVQRIAQEGLVTGTFPAIDIRIRRPDGSVRQVHMESELTVDEAAQPRTLVGTVLDQTEGRRREELLGRTIAELLEAQTVAHLGSFALYLKENPPRLEWSTGLAVLLGLPIDTSPSPDVFLACVHPDDLAEVKAVYEAVLSEEQLPPEARSLEYRIVSPHGTVREVISRTSELRDQDGRVVGCQGVVQDVTERKELEAQLRQSQKMEAIGNLAGGIAHDFNNYLTVLSGNGDLLSELVPAGDPARDCVDAVNDVVRRCAHLTQQLLLFSRKRTADLARIDLRKTLMEMKPMLYSVMGETVSLEFKFGTGSSDILADTVPIEQAVLNLCLNARDAMPSGGAIRVEIASVYEDSSGKPKAWVRLRVTDTGCGISREDRNRIFEPFFTTKEAGKGTGLGLATTYGIVRDAGGRIDVESEEGEGTTFTLLFPKTNAGGPRASIPPAQLREGNGEAILVVEDVEQLRELIGRLLRRAGYRVFGAEDGAAALELLSQEPMDLVLSDIVMPGLSGPKLLSKIAEKHPRLPAVLMTGYAADAHGPAGLQHRVLRKPFSTTELLTQVRTALDRRTPNAPALKLV